MDHPERDFLKEDDFERILMAQADEFAATETMRATTSVNPWAGSIGSLVWGFLLLSIHVNFFGFPPEFVFTMLGLLLIVKGFAQIAHLSFWLRSGFILSLITAIWYAGDLILDCTAIVMPDAYNLGMTGYMIAIRVILFYLLYKGLPLQVEQEGQRAKVVKHLKSNLQCLLVTYVLVAIGIYLNGTWLAWGVMIFYIVFLREIYRGLTAVRGILEEYAYDIKPASGYVGACVRGLMIGVIIALVIGMPLTMYLVAKPGADMLREDVSDGSNRIFYGMDPGKVYPGNGQPEERIKEDWDRFFEDIEAECAETTYLAIREENNLLSQYQALSGTEKTSIQSQDIEEIIHSIRDQMIQVGVDEAIVQALPASEILRYEGITEVYHDETWEMYEVKEEDPITYQGYLCYMEEYNTYRFLFYGSWREMPSRCYTDGIVLWLRDHFGPYADMTGGAIGEDKAGYYYLDMDAVSFSAYGDVGCRLAATLPVPGKGERFDFYLGMDCIPNPYRDSVENRIDTPHFAFDLNIYHRNKLWCYPGQTAAEALQEYKGSTIDAILYGNTANRILENWDYFSVFVEGMNAE